jgi:hypothetical protein
MLLSMLLHIIMQRGLSSAPDSWALCWYMFMKKTATAELSYSFHRRANTNATNLQANTGIITATITAELRFVQTYKRHIDDRLLGCCAV